MDRPLVADRRTWPLLEAELAKLPAGERRQLEKRARAELERDHAAVDRARGARRSEARVIKVIDELLEPCIEARIYEALEQAHPEIRSTVLAACSEPSHA